MKKIELVHTTKPFMSGRSQAVRIPKEYRLSDEEVIISKVGDAIMITPKAKVQELFFSGIEMLTEDFMSDGRPEEIPNERVIL